MFYAPTQNMFENHSQDVDCTRSWTVTNHKGFCLWRIGGPRPIHKCKRNQLFVVKLTVTQLFNKNPTLWGNWEKQTVSESVLMSTLPFTSRSLSPLPFMFPKLNFIISHLSHICYMHCPTENVQIQSSSICKLHYSPSLLPLCTNISLSTVLKYRQSKSLPYRHIKQQAQLQFCIY
jgi:hypothetical protein